MQNFALIATALLVVAFFLGCIVGCILRGLLRREEVQVEASEAAPKPDLKARAATAVQVDAEEAEARSAEDSPETLAPAPTAAEPPMREPKPAPGFSDRPQASIGEPDDLKRIKGVGPVIEKKLKAMGVERFEQIANWTRADVEKIDTELKFRGRIDREDWIAQAKALAEDR